MQYSKLMDEKALSHMCLRAEQLLENRGMEIAHTTLCEKLLAAGCEKKKGRICFPRKLIKEAIAHVPQKFTLCSPDRTHDLHFPCRSDSFYTRANTGACIWRTVEGEARPIHLADAEEWVQLVNSMENIDFFALPSIAGEDIPPEAADLYALCCALKHSRKHIWIQPYGTQNVSGLIAMCQAAAGDAEKLRARPFVSFISCSVPLLTMKAMDAEILLQCAEAGIPVQPCSLPTAGANAPVTAQGTALVCCAEVLAQIIILQLLCPGLPVVATPLPFAMDMMTTYTLQSTPEITLGRLLCIQFFEDGYGIPAHTYASGTDSLIEDGQSLIERVSLAHTLAFSGASVLGGAGQLETAKAIGPLTLLLDNEIFGIVKRLRRGLTINDETLDWDDLVGDPEEIREGFITTEHTLRHYKEMARPSFFNREGVPVWKNKGCLSLEDRLRARYKELLSMADTSILTPDREKAVNTVFSHAVQSLVGKDKT